MNEWSFDTLAANLKADSQDLASFHQVLATKLEQALPPGAVQIRRKGLPWQTDRPVVKIQIDLGTIRLDTERSGSGFRYRVEKMVRGIALKSEEVGFDGWLDALSHALWEYARANERTREAMERFLI